MALEDNLNNDRIPTSFNAVMFDDAAFEVFFKKHFAIYADAVRKNAVR